MKLWFICEKKAA